MQFPNGALGETATQNLNARNGIPFPKQACSSISRNPHSNWDAVSQASLFRKLHPALKGKTETRFPGGASKRKLRWNSSCLRLQPAKTGTISPQLMRGWEMPALATKCHLRGLGGHSQRHVTETHIGYGMPSSTDTQCSAGLPSNEARRSPRRSAQCRQSADTAK